HVAPVEERVVGETDLTLEPAQIGTLAREQNGLPGSALGVDHPEARTGRGGLPRRRRRRKLLGDRGHGGGRRRHLVRRLPIARGRDRLRRFGRWRRLGRLLLRHGEAALDAETKVRLERPATPAARTRRLGDLHDGLPALLAEPAGFGVLCTAAPATHRKLELTRDGHVNLLIIRGGADAARGRRDGSAADEAGAAWVTGPSR